MKKFILKLFKIKSERVKAAERLLELIEIGKKYESIYPFIFQNGLCYLNVALIAYNSKKTFILNIEAIKLLHIKGYINIYNDEFWFKPGDFESRIKYLNEVKSENN